MIRKTASTYKKKNLYIYIYRQKEKAGKNSYKRAQKKGLCNIVPNNPEKVRLFGGFFGGCFCFCFACFGCNLRVFVCCNLLL